MTARGLWCSQRPRIWCSQKRWRSRWGLAFCFVRFLASQWQPPSTPSNVLRPFPPPSVVLAIPGRFSFVVVFACKSGTGASVRGPGLVGVHSFPSRRYCHGTSPPPPLPRHRSPPACVSSRHCWELVWWTVVGSTPTPWAAWWRPSPSPAATWRRAVQGVSTPPPPRSPPPCACRGRLSPLRISCPSFFFLTYTLVSFHKLHKSTGYP